MRATDPEALVRVLVDAGAVPDDPAAAARRAAGQDVRRHRPGGAAGRGPGRRRCDRAERRPRHAALPRPARSSRPRRPPACVMRRRDPAPRGRHRRRLAGRAGGHRPGARPDIVQCSGDEPAGVVATVSRPVWKTVHLERAAEDATAAAGGCAGGRPGHRRRHPDLAGDRAGRACPPRYGWRAARRRHRRGGGSSGRRHRWRARCRSCWPAGSTRDRGRGAAGRAGHRRRCSLRHRPPAPPRAAPAQGPVQGGAVRQACPGRPLRPPDGAGPADPRLGRPPGGGCARPVGHGPRVRRPLRARDAGRRARAARGGLGRRA